MMPVHGHVNAWCFLRLEEGNGVTDNYGLPYLCSKLNPGPKQEVQGVLAIEPSLQLPAVCLMETGSHKAWARLKYLILLPLLPECWD